MIKEPPPASIYLEVRLNGTETDAQSLQAYDEVYADAGLSQSDSFYLWLMEILNLQPTDRYLDVSCGHAELVNRAQKRGITAYGLDLSTNALRTGSRLLPDETLTTANAQQLPFPDASFSVVSNIGSIEHYTDMPVAVSEMARVLEDNGRAIILLPNTFSLLQNVWHAARSGRTVIDYDQPIQRYAARYEWQALLEENGLEVVDTLKYDRVMPRTRADWRRYLNRPKELVRATVGTFVPLNLAFCFVFICRKV